MEYRKDICLLHVNYILLADTVDRLDMILLELRHLQRNIIYSMHEPAFNAPLRFEEDFLWGGKEESNTIWKLSKTEDEKDVQKNIILFPIPSQKEDNEYVCNKTPEEKRKEKREYRRKRITAFLQIRINKLWREEWRMRHQRSYDHLRGTQLLKHIIVQDKIDFCRFAINNAGLVPGKTTVVKPAQLSQFIILRNAIHQRCKDYLARIMEYQSLFNKVLDIGVKDFPVPSLERRREIGIYMDFLNKRVRSAHKETEHLVRRLKINKKDIKNKEDIILHSWKHDFTATHSFQEYPKKVDGENEKEFNIHHVVSNYYMPERPDLQPMLTHEIAHIMIHEYMKDLSDSFFEDADDNFSDLIRSIFRVLRKYDNILYIHDLSPAHNPRFLLKEICCDMLAASVKGFSYLYAMLLELVGADMYKHLLSGALEFTNESSRTIDLEMINHLYGNGGRPETLRRDWWLRLKLIVSWMKNVHHHENSGLDDMLLDGVDSLLDNFLCFLEKITLDPADRKKSVDIWRSLADRLIEEIEDSGAVSDVKKWRDNRSKAKTEEVEDMPFPRSVAPINKAVRDTLKKIHIGMKIKEGKALYGFANKNRCKEDIDKSFYERCVLKKKNDNSDEDIDKYYINHLYDISWKCALTRTIDLFGIPDKEDGGKLDNNCHWLSHYDKDKRNKILDALHRDNAIGRELHSIALEFYMFESENPFDRLVHVYFLIKDADSIFSNETKKLIEDMGKHRGNLHKERRIEIKSKDLLESIIQNVEDFSLKNYLIAYSEPEKKNILLDCSGKNALIKNILDRITCVHNSPDKCKKNIGNDVARCFKMLLISRHTASGFYAMKEKDEHPVFTSKEYSPVSLLKGESYWFWPQPQKKKSDNADKQEEECVYPEEIFKYSNVSGRYDAISFVRARHMRRCSFPHFETKNTPNLDEYRFPSILTRREFGIKVDLRPLTCQDQDGAKSNQSRYYSNCTPHKNQKEDTQDNELAGYISVTLKRRALRLPFLARLMAAVDDKNDKMMQPEKWLGAYLKDTDTALLLDGSADFLLVLRMKNKKSLQQDNLDPAEHRLKRTGHVIDMAYWLYQDFMVDRTEIILSAAVIDDVAEEIADKYESKFSLECELRCFEDRMLAGGIDSFRTQLEDGIKDSKGDLLLLVTIEITAGRKDFLLRFFHPACCVPNAEEWKFSKKTNDENTGFRAALAELLDPKLLDDKGKSGILFVDRIEVNVNKQPPKERLTS